MRQMQTVLAVAGEVGQEKMRLEAGILSQHRVRGNGAHDRDGR